MKITYLTALVLATVFTSHASAMMILVDFNQVALSSHNGTWNNVAAFGNSNLALVDSTGGATTATLSDDLTNAFSHPNAWTGGTADWVHDTAADDLFGFNGASATVTIGGLSGAQYKVDIVSGWESAGPVSTIITIGGAAADTTSNGAPVVNPWNAGTGSATNYLIWNAITPTANAITINMTKAGSFGGINALRLTEVTTAVPEASTSLPILALVAGLAYARRRKK